MSIKMKDLTGMKFGRLTVIEYAGKNKYNHFMWLCECSCENKNRIVTRGTALTKGATKSCGCISKEKNLKRLYKHGNSHKRLHKIWRMMKDRCYNENHVMYHHYGGRGIKICDEWLNDYLIFEKWALENGYDSNLTLDRINNNGHYCPKNCRWATEKEQKNNTRSNVHITINNETRTVAQWAELLNLKPILIYSRINKGWTGEALIEQPKKSKSGEKYIYWHKQSQKWSVRITCEGKKNGKFLGSFSSLDEAIKARDEYLLKKTSELDSNFLK